MIQVHRDFRLFATQNPAMGDFKGMREELSVSLMDRFRIDLFLLNFYYKLVAFSAKLNIHRHLRKVYIPAVAEQGVGEGRRRLVGPRIGSGKPCENRNLRGGDGAFPQRSHVQGEPIIGRVHGQQPVHHSRALEMGRQHRLVRQPGVG